MQLVLYVSLFLIDLPRDKGMSYQKWNRKYSKTEYNY